MQRRWSGIIVHAVDRLGRGDMMEYGWIQSVLQLIRTLIVIPRKAHDPANRENYHRAMRPVGHARRTATQPPVGRCGRPEKDHRLVEAAASPCGRGGLCSSYFNT